MGDEISSFNKIRQDDAIASYVCQNTDRQVNSYFFFSLFHTQGKTQTMQYAATHGFIPNDNFEC